MAGMKSKVYPGRCLAVLWTLWAKISSGTKECSEGEWGQSSKEKPAQPGTDGVVDYFAYLRPTKALNL